MRQVLAEWCWPWVAEQDHQEDTGVSWPVGAAWWRVIGNDVF